MTLNQIKPSSPLLKNRIIEYETELSQILSEDVAKFRNTLGEHKLGPLMFDLQP